MDLVRWRSSSAPLTALDRRHSSIALHRVTYGIPNRVVLFRGLDEVEDGDAGATVFADRSGNRGAHAFSIGDVAYDASLLHFGAKKTSWC